MELKYDFNHVIESLKIKLGDAESRASQFEAVAIYKDNEIKKLEDKLKKLEEKGSAENENNVK